MYGDFLQLSTKIWPSSSVVLVVDCNSDQVDIYYTWIFFGPVCQNWLLGNGIVLARLGHQIVRSYFTVLNDRLFLLIQEVSLHRQTHKHGRFIMSAPVRWLHCSTNHFFIHFLFPAWHDFIHCINVRLFTCSVSKYPLYSKQNRITVLYSFKSRQFYVGLYLVKRVSLGSHMIILSWVHVSRANFVLMSSGWKFHTSIGSLISG